MIDEQFSYLICLDLEYTCWENSMRDNWPDPKFPAEVIQVGMASFNMAKSQYLDKFSSYVRPVLNPRLSDYCINLLQIPQSTIDNSPALPEVIDQISSFVNGYNKDSTLVCAYGPDCKRFADDAARHYRDRPLDSFTYLNLQQEAGKILGRTDKLPGRDYIKEHFQLPPSENRHDALDDALDVKLLLDTLVEYEK